jgi:hypothetical protein
MCAAVIETQPLRKQRNCTFVYKSLFPIPGATGLEGLQLFIFPAAIPMLPDRSLLFLNEMKNQMYRSITANKVARLGRSETLKLEPYTTRRKYKEAAHMPLVVQPINQPRQICLPSRLTLSQQKSENYSSVQLRLCEKCLFYVGNI